MRRNTFDVYVIN